MDFKEAFDAMVNGKRVRSEYWDKDNYIYTYGNIIFDESNEVYLPNGSAITGKWELCEEPVNTEIEINLNFLGALAAMIDGKKIRMERWDEDEYVYIDKSIIFDKDEKTYMPTKDEILNNNWEVYKETK